MCEPSPAESFWMHEFLPKDVGNVLFFNRDNAFIIYVSRILWILNCLSRNLTDIPL